MVLGGDLQASVGNLTLVRLTQATQETGEISLPTLRAESAHEFAEKKPNQRHDSVKSSTIALKPCADAKTNTQQNSVAREFKKYPDYARHSSAPVNEKDKHLYILIEQQEQVIQRQQVHVSMTC